MRATIPMRAGAVSFLLVLALTGCWYAEMRTEMSPTQLAAVDDATWCKAARYTVASHLATASTNFQNEFDRRYRRGITCGIPIRQSPDEKDEAQCLSYGAAPGTDTYVNCRLALKGQREGRAAATSNAIIGAGLQLMATPPPRPAVPLGIDCSVTPGSLGRSVGCW
jgi:hypothetical protein